MNNIIVKTTGLKKYYQLGKHRVKALDGVDFSVEEGEFVSIIGKSGSGKSTLLHLIGGLDTPTAGDVCVDNIHLAKMSREELAVFRRRNIGFIFQNYNLVPDLNVFENITLPVELDGGKPDREFIREILSLLQLEDKTEALPGIQFISGVKMFLTSEFTIAVNAPPTIMPTAISKTLPRVINSLNSLKNFFIFHS